MLQMTNPNAPLSGQRIYSSIPYGEGVLQKGLFEGKEGETAPTSGVSIMRERELLVSLVGVSQK